MRQAEVQAKARVLELGVARAGLFENGSRRRARSVPRKRSPPEGVRRHVGGAVFVEWKRAALALSCVEQERITREDLGSKVGRCR